MLPTRLKWSHFQSNAPNQLRSAQIRSTYVLNLLQKPCSRLFNNYSALHTRKFKSSLSSFTGTIEAQEATMYCYGQPYHLQGNDSNSAAWGICILWSTFILYAQERFCKTDLSPCKNSYWKQRQTCWMLYMLLPQWQISYIVKLKTELFLKQSVQLYNHIGKSPQNTDLATFCTTPFKTKKPDITLCASIKFNW